MAYFFFIDESGQDQRQSPYEVLAAVAIEDIKLWPLIKELHKAEEEIFGLRYKDFGNELKAKKLLNKKTFRLAAQMGSIGSDLRKQAARRCIENGPSAGKLELTALAQAKLEYVKRCISICSNFDCKVFASIIDKAVERPNLKCPRCELLRKDYSHVPPAKPEACKTVDRSKRL